MEEQLACGLDAAREGRIDAAVGCFAEGIQLAGGISVEIRSALERLLVVCRDMGMDSAGHEVASNLIDNLSAEPVLAGQPYEVALLYDAVGQKEKACHFYKLAMASEPCNDPLRFNYLSALVEVGKAGEMLDVFEAATERFKRSRSADLLASWVRDRGRYREALQLYQVLVEATEGPQKARYQLAAGLLFESLGDEGRAKQAYAAAVSLKPDYAYALLRLAQIEGAGYNLSDAIKHCRQALETDKTMAQATALLGWLYYRRGDYDEASENYRQYYEASGITSTLERMGNCYYALARYYEAEHVLKEMHTKCEGTSQSWMLLGQILLKQGRFSEAIPLLEKALQLGPGMNDAYRFLGEAYSALEQYQEALDAYQSYLEKAAPTPEILVDMAHAYILLDRADLAQETSAEAVDLSRCHVFARQYLALAALARDDRATFEAELSIMERLDPQIHEALKDAAEEEEEE